MKTYYWIDNRKFCVETTDKGTCILTILEENPQGVEKFTYRYKGDNALRAALEEILSYSGIDAEDFEEG